MSSLKLLCLLELLTVDRWEVIYRNRVTQSYLYPILGDNWQSIRENCWLPYRQLDRPERIFQAAQLVREPLCQKVLFLPQHWRSGLWFLSTSGTPWDLWVVYILRIMRLLLPSFGEIFQFWRNWYTTVSQSITNHVIGTGIERDRWLLQTERNN